MTGKGIPIFPVRTEEDHDRAVARISQLIGAKAGSAASDELDMLATLVDAYEARRFPMDMPSPIDAIVFRMEQQGITRKELEPYIGTRARVSEVLSAKRPLTLSMIRKLHHGLGIPAKVLVGSAIDKAGLVGSSRRRSAPGGRRRSVAA